MNRTRRLLLKGLYNARDLGGYPTADGGVTRFGVFLRSEAPCELCAEDIDALSAYGVTASADFRSRGEREARHSSLEGVMPYHPAFLFAEAAIYGAMPPPPPGAGAATWAERYAGMAEGAKDWAVRVLNLAAENEGCLLYHCTTGKDRTGLMSCYLLSIAGVSREDIAADYCVSEIYLEPVYEKMRAGAVNLGAPPPGGGHPMQGEGENSFFHTPASAMLGLIDYLSGKYGSVVDFLKSIGVTEETMQKIREKFVEK